MAELSHQILCTLGPASMNGRVIARMEALGVRLFRINLSHTALAALAQTIDLIRRHTEVPICLDTEGAQIRTGALVDGAIEVRENRALRVHRRRVPGDAGNLNLHPAHIADELRIGDFLSIDFNAVLVQVTGREGDAVLMRVLNGGVIGQNKAVTVDRPIRLPALTEKDREAIRVGAAMGLRHFALSFANRGSDVDEIRALAGDDAFIISKIETRSGVAHLEGIIARSDALLIDRGDLAREISIEQIPRLQKSVIRAAKRMGVKVYVATNLLESMVTRPVPTRAEVNDIHNTLLDGADGLVLAAETAIGAFPIECASMIVKMIQGFESGGDDQSHYPDDPVSLLVEPHGGRLVHREADGNGLRDIERLPALAVPVTVLMDCEQIAHGTYSPLTGFMDRETLESVLADNRLPDGPVWTLPLLLQTTAEAARRFGPGERVALCGEGGTVHALIDVREVYAVDMANVARRCFGTDSTDHPGVARLFAAGERFVAGDITLVERLPSPYRHYELTPAQTRFIFTHKGWSRVVGFHTRNPVHRGHESIQIRALEQTGADGLYINPVIGPKKKGDFLPEPIMMSYQTMLEFGYYPKNGVVLGSFATYSRYAGPREAVFTALARKNMGCSHFIIGRDHTGVGDFYGPDANRALFERLGDIGIAPVFFDAVGYDPETGDYRPIGGGNRLLEISGTRIRKALRAGERLPEWIMREVVQETLQNQIAANRALFVE